MQLRGAMIIPMPTRNYRTPGWEDFRQWFKDRTINFKVNGWAAYLNLPMDRIVS
jgi:hypothetical protein